MHLILHHQRTQLQFLAGFYCEFFHHLPRGAGAGVEAVADAGDERGQGEFAAARCFCRLVAVYRSGTSWLDLLGLAFPQGSNASTAASSTIGTLAWLRPFWFVMFPWAEPQDSKQNVLGRLSPTLPAKVAETPCFWGASSSTSGYLLLDPYLSHFKTTVAHLKAALGSVEEMRELPGGEQCARHYRPAGAIHYQPRELARALHDQADIFTWASRRQIENQPGQ